MPALDVLLNLAGMWSERFLGLPGALPVILLCLAGNAMGAMIARRADSLRILFISGVAVWLINIGSEDIGLTVAAFTSFEAVRSFQHRHIKRHLVSVEEQINVLQNTIDPFINALENRSHQIDLWNSERAPQSEAITSPPRTG